jgi:translation initiation factor IF-2
LREERRTAAAEAAEAAALPTGPIMLPGPMTLKEFSALSKLKETEIIRHLFMKGMMVTVNQTLDIDVMISVGEAMELDVRKPEVQDLSLVEVASVLDQAPTATAEEQVLLEPRPPVISIMGHVDHGKTSLLDAIRQSRHKIVDTEAGGITQRIGAYTVEQDGKTIVFLDTPGHEAFTSMRMRGAQATDIAILVVAADDGVMPQTIEAINHAKAAKLPIIVAINKVDKEGADPMRTKSALMEHGLIDESLGGETIMVEVSALQKLGIDDLLEMILLVSEVQNLQANPNTLAEGVIIEAKLDKRKGPVATALVQKGTLKVGENILIGSVGGRVRALINDMGERILEAGPSMPVEILGLDDVPHAGDGFRVIANDKEFKSFLSSEKIKRREERLSQRSRMAGGLTVSMDDENKKELRLVLKADTQGSLEAASQAIARLATEEVGVNILHTATGDVTEADVMLATASQALIIGFNVKEDGNAGRIAEQEAIDIQKFDVIYHMVELVQDRMLGELDAEIHETQSGQAEVRALFNIGKTMVVAGCMVTEGKIVRNAKATVKRAGKVVFEGTVDVLKRFKDDAKEVAQGYECGISFSKFNQVEIGDTITCTVEEKRARTSLKAN